MVPTSTHPSLYSTHKTHMFMLVTCALSSRHKHTRSVTLVQTRQQDSTEQQTPTSVEGGCL